MSGEITYRRYAGCPSPKPKYLTDSISGAYYGYWTTTVGAISQSFADKMSGDALCSLYNNLPVSHRMDLIFNERQNIRNLVLDFWAKASNALGLLVYTMAGIGDFTSYTMRAVNILTTWARYIVPMDTFSASVGNRGNTLVRNKSLAFYNNGAQSDIYLSGMTIRRLP